MKRLLVLIGGCVLALCGGSVAAALDDTAAHDVTVNVTEVALINAVGTDPAFTIGVGDGAVGGEEFGVSPAAAGEKYLQYTSIVALGETRTITAEIDESDLPPGTTLFVAATAAAGGKGSLGNAGAEIDLNDDAQPIITSIGSGYTGTGGADGVQLTYRLSINDGQEGMLAAAAGDYTIEVTYTLTAGE
jgi:hypothetical protein